MGISADNLLFKEAEEMQKVLEFQARRRWVARRNKRARRVIMKDRSRLGGSRRGGNIGINKRVRTLKKLIPNTESMGVEGLFRETADYILSLKMRVKVMQIMVKVLTGSDE